MLDLISAYENYLTKVKQASSNTVFSYMRDIRQFSDWLERNGEVTVLEADQQNISRYLAHLQEMGHLQGILKLHLDKNRHFDKQDTFQDNIEIIL